MTQISTTPGAIPTGQVKASGKPLALLPTAQAHKADSFARSPLLNHPTTHNAVKLLLTADDSRKALLASIASAQSSFTIQTFEFHDDATGNEVLAALAARKRKAVAEGKPFDVRVLLDGYGMSGRAGDRVMVDRLKASGAEVQVFNANAAPGAVLTHRKLYIQDGTSFITGGRNVGDEYMRSTFVDPKTQQRATSWHDFQVNIEGDETERAVASFFQDWAAAGGLPPDRYPESTRKPTGQVRTQSFGTDPQRDIFSIRRVHQGMIANAKKEIVLVVPYLSDDTLLDQLIAAKARRPGLAIKVMVPGVAENSVGGQTFQVLNAQSAARLTAAGIDVRFYMGGQEGGKALSRFSHLKAMAVDGQLLSIGSANGDARSYQANHEMITVMDDHATTQDFLDKVATPDWKSSRPYDPRVDTGTANSPFIAILSQFKGLL